MARQWLGVARDGWARLRSGSYRRPDGLFINRAAADGTPLDTGRRSLRPGVRAPGDGDAARRGPLGGCDLAGEAKRTLDALQCTAGWRAAASGSAAHTPTRPTATCISRRARSPGRPRASRSGRRYRTNLRMLALTRFIDPETGVLREFFDADWRAPGGEDGLVEPGHQFEWAWLLQRWGRLRGEGWRPC